MGLEGTKVNEASTPAIKLLYRESTIGNKAVVTSYYA
jgi:hypothetical protein